MTKAMFRHVSLAFLFISVACTGQGAKPAPHSPSMTSPAEAPRTAKPDVRPIVDVAPYWCDLVPKEALARVAGPEHGLAELRSPESSADHELCGVRDAERYGPLGMTWDLKNGRESLDSSLRQVAADHPQRLPARFGSGFVVYSPTTSHLPYESGSLFPCGAREPWIYLALRSVAPGRNAVQDLTDLMRIAQERFGRLHRCTPRALRG